MILPNSDLITRKVINWTRDQYRRRFIITLYTETDVVPKEVQKIMAEAASTVEGVLDSPPPATYFEGMEQFAYRFSLYYWLNGDLFDIKSNAQLSIHQALREAGVALKKGHRLEWGGDQEPPLPQEKDKN